MLDPPRNITNIENKVWTRLFTAGTKPARPPAAKPTPPRRSRGFGWWTQPTADARHRDTAPPDAARSDLTASARTQRATIAYIADLAEHDEGEDLHPARLDAVTDELTKAMARERRERTDAERHA